MFYNSVLTTVRGLIAMLDVRIALPAWMAIVA